MAVPWMPSMAIAFGIIQHIAQCSLSPARYCAINDENERVANCFLLRFFPPNDSCCWWWWALPSSSFSSNNTREWLSSLSFLLPQNVPKYWEFRLINAGRDFHFIDRNGQEDFWVHHRILLVFPTWLLHALSISVTLFLNL